MEKKEKNFELERLVFFSDAVVAIAITLLALDLKVDVPDNQHLTFAAIGHSWEKFFGFFLSFLIIAVFWKVHHQFYFYIKKIDARLLFYNLIWLLFIVLLPFATTLVSAHFFDTPAVFTYSLVIFFITCAQNLIWDHVAVRPDYLKEHLTEKINREYRVACNIAMINAILAMIISFISPMAAFIILSTRIVMLRIARVVLPPPPPSRNNRDVPKGGN
jgi:uncharacterized membrane protein